MSSFPNDGAAWLEDSQRNQIPIMGFCSIGRSASNHVALSSQMVSRRHAIIQVQRDQEFWLVDFGSYNGTYLNRQRIIRPTRLHDSDRLKIGPFEFVFHVGRSDQTAMGETTFKDATVPDIRHLKCWLLVADIVDSTNLIKEVALEELPIVTGRWLAECRRTIEEHEGRINQFMGDGFFAYWRAREGFEPVLVRALLTLRRFQEQALPAFRVVLHHGQVVVGGVSVGEEERISGQDVHFAFRMEKLAATLGEQRIMSGAAWDRLGPLLQTKELGSHTLPHFDKEFSMYAF